MSCAQALVGYKERGCVFGQQSPRSMVHKEADEAYAFARGIIGRVSRTFALGIVVLPGDLGRAVLIGYLLCRIADTIEDDGSATPARRQELLARFLRCFQSRERADAFASEATDIKGDPAHLELLAGNAHVFAVLRSLPEKSREILERWVREMVTGMSEFVGRYPAGIRIQTVEEYRTYCYYVAGTVGRLLTELWRFHSPFVGEREYERLLPHAEAFGEGLQTVNILKDIAWDIERENSAYVPEELLVAAGMSQGSLLQPERKANARQALAALTRLAHDDLRASAEYFTLLPKRAARIRLFCLLPIVFAVATLREIDRSTAMLESGGGVKISRREVRSLIIACAGAVWSNTLVHRLIDAAGKAPFLLPGVGTS
jgi:farnesyl-diphosphate farnesyltransferase